MSNFNYGYDDKKPNNNGVVYGQPVAQGQPYQRPPQGPSNTAPPNTAYTAPPGGYPQNAGPYGGGPANYYPPPTNQTVYYAPAQQPYYGSPQNQGPGMDTCCTACLAALCCCCLMDMIF
jgi:hypothetical protein